MKKLFLALAVFAVVADCPAATFTTSDFCTNEYAGIASGTVPNPGAPQNDVLQGLLDQATNGPLTLVVDGHYTVRDLGIRANTRITANPGCGFILASNACEPVIGNLNWTNGAGGILDSNILIDGLTVNCAMTYQHTTGPHVTAAFQRGTGSGFGRGTNFTGALCGFQFIGVQNLTLTNVTVLNNDRAGDYYSGVGNYAFFTMNFSNVMIDQCRADIGGPFAAFATDGADGFHFNGPGRRLTIQNCWIASGDDAIALNADDGVGANWPATNVAPYSPYYTGGPLSDIIISNICFGNCAAGIRLLSGADKIQNVWIGVVSGTCASQWVKMDSYDPAWTYPWGTGHFGNLVFSNINLTAYGSYFYQSAFYYLELGSSGSSYTNYCDSLYLDDIVCANAANHFANIAALGINGSFGTAVITNCTLTAILNTRDWGGVGSIDAPSGGTLVLNNNRFTETYPPNQIPPWNNVGALYFNGPPACIITNVSGSGNSVLGFSSFFYNASSALNLNMDPFLVGTDLLAPQYHLITNGVEVYLSTLILPPVVLSASLPAGKNSVAYNQPLNAGAGVVPYSWMINSGTLPSGLALATNGIISGTPTTNGIFSFTVELTDAASETATQALTLNVFPPDPPPLTSVTLLLSGPAGSNYVLQVSTNLLHWSPVSTSTIPVNGTITISNTLSDYRQRFYRYYFQ